MQTMVLVMALCVCPSSLLFIITWREASTRERVELFGVRTSARAKYYIGRSSSGSNSTIHHHLAQHQHTNNKNIIIIINIAVVVIVVSWSQFSAFPSSSLSQRLFSIRLTICCVSLAGHQRVERAKAQQKTQTDDDVDDDDDDVPWFRCKHVAR